VAVDRTVETIANDQTRVAVERGAVRAYQAAIDDSTPELRRIRSALADIDHALTDTRPQRVLAAGADPTSDLSTVLGPRPEHPVGHAIWSAIAERIETWRDHTPPAASPTYSRTTKTSRLLGPRPLYGNAREWDHLGQLVDRSQQLIAHAVANDRDPSPQLLDDPTRWQAMLDLVERAAQVEARHRHVEHDYGIEL